MSSSGESGTEQAILPTSTIPNKERHTERVIGRRGLREFLVVDHTANLRKNSKISPIWKHGGERRRLDERRNDIHWNPISWWIDESNKGNYDSLYLYALDQLSCPAMATECERVFSAAKMILPPERNAFRP
jgi:hypothetical protein